MSTTFYPKIDGTTTAVADLMTNLSGRGHEVQLLTRRFTNTPKLERWKGLQINRIGPATKSSLSRIILFINQIVVGGLIIRRSRTNLIHTNSFISLYAALVLGRLFHIPTVMTFNGSQRIWRPDARWQSNANLAITLPLESYAMKHAGAVLVQSQELKPVIEQLYNAKGSRVKVIPHPVDLDVFKPSSYQSDKTAHVILFVGTLGRIHGPDLFVKGIGPVLKEFPNAKFLIVGSGPLREFLEKMTIATNVHASVEFLGPIYDRQELSKLYQSCSVVVIPVRYPSHILTKVATEAMASAKPIVTTMELEKSLSDYGIFMTKTDPAQIAGTIIKVLKMGGQQYQAACLAGRAYVERYCSKDTVTSMTERVYSHLLHVKD